MPTSPMPNPRDYPDPIGYAVASADWWRARVHVINPTRRVFPAATAPALALAVGGMICGLAIVGLTARKLSQEKIIMSSAPHGVRIPAGPGTEFAGKATP